MVRRLDISYEQHRAAELDLTEILGQTPGYDTATIHYSGGFSSQSIPGPNFSAGFHVFGMDWGT